MIFADMGGGGEIKLDISGQFIHSFSFFFWILFEEFVYYPRKPFIFPISKKMVTRHVLFEKIYNPDDIHQQTIKKSSLIQLVNSFF